jgi:hypothetical protein
MLNTLMTSAANLEGDAVVNPTLTNTFSLSASRKGS